MRVKRRLSSEINPSCSEFLYILKNKAALAAFKAFLEERHAEENLLLYLQIQTFKQLCDPEELRKEADSIFKEFLVERAPHQVNIIGHLVEAVKIKLQASESINSSLFSDIQQHVFEQMEFDCYPKFRTSSFWDEDLLINHNGASRRGRNSTTHK